MLYFKEVTVNTENYSQRSRSLHLRDKRHKQFSTPQKENPQEKKKRKEKARSSVGRSFEKSHNTNTKFHFRDVTITSRDYKIFLYILENYNQQSRSPHHKKITIRNAFPTLADHDRPTLVKAKTTRKGKRKGRKKRKAGGRGNEGRIGIMEKAGLKSVPS